MISLEKAREAFEKYVATYDIENNKIIMRYDHSMRVSNRCVELARSLKLSKEKVLVAGLIGLLHDIGKFEQLKRFGCCEDGNTIEHGNFGCEVLFKENMIRDFVTDRKYDRLMEKAIQVHDKSKMEGNHSDEERTFMFILRDANNLDVLFRLSRCDCKLYNEFITEEVLKNVDARLALDLKLVKTSLDLKIFHLCSIYELSFPVSLSIVKRERFIDKAIEKLQLKDSKAKMTMDNIKNKLHKYVEEKIGGC